MIKMPLFSFLKKKGKSEYFIALLLRDEKVSAVIFEEKLGKIQAKGYHEKYFSTSIEDISTDEFINALDESISGAEGDLKDVETQKTVFGLKENWIEDLKIKKEYLQKLKKTSEALDLKPLGFMEIHEAITHLMSEEEGAPVSAILIEVDKKNIAVSILRAGRIVDTKRAKIEESIPKTCDKILHSFDCEILPAKIVIFDGQDSEDLQQQFIAHVWSKSLSFLHVPQISILPKAFDARAILFGAAKQMGFEVLEEESKKMEIEKQEVEKEELKKAELEETAPEENVEENFENFGFIKNDIAKPLLKKGHNIQIVKEEEIILSDENKDLSDKNSSALSALKSSPSLLGNILKNFRFPNLPKTNKKLIFIPPLILGFLILILFFYLFSLKATITINATPKVVEENQDITFSATTPTDISNKIIYSQITDVSQEGEASKDVTGKKEVGTSAKGTITIYSRLPQSKTFSQGTAIKANGLEFTLDKAVIVASSSGDASSSPSTANVDVTAKNIGKESNLPSGTKFSASGFDLSDVVAKNDSAFSGGTKKEITAVAKSDMDQLLSDLPKNLEEKAKESISQKIDKDQELLPIFIDESVEKKEFDHKIGDEALKITIKGTVSFKGVSYKKSEIGELSKSLIKNDAGLDLAKAIIKYEIKNPKVKKGNEITSRLYVKANLLPKIDNQKLAEEIAGKSFEEAEKILSSLPQVSNVEILENPRIPFLPKILPRLPKNITLTLKSVD
ncbi:MAG: baseplate J/gp47 family protein [bacterium]|nr:baseplate J/gp47 family protein [bacterium]